MKIRQLQYVVETDRQRFNVSHAALALNTSQPGVSKQIRLLEKELGASLFMRESGRLIGLTAIGKELIDRMKRIVIDADYIAATCKALTHVTSGVLTIATTHVQACYLLPEIIEKFRARYPKVRITLRQMNPQQILEVLQSGDADLGITSDMKTTKELIVLPYRKYGRVVLVPEGHPLLGAREITLRSLANYPLITYEASYISSNKILQSFEKSGFMPSDVLSVSNADVIKTCVERNLGIGVMLGLAYDRKRDKHLRVLPARHLFPAANVGVIVNRNHYLKLYEFDFIEQLSRKWNRARIQRAMTAA